MPFLSPNQQCQSIIIIQTSARYTISSLKAESEIKIKINYDCHLFAFDNSRRVGIHYEPAQSFVWRSAITVCRPRQHEVPVCQAAVSDPHLLPVEHERVSLADCFRTNTGDVRSGPRLCYAVCLKPLNQNSIQYSAYVRQ